MELKYSKQKQLGRKKGKEKQSYIKFLNLYKSTNRLPEGMNKETKTSYIPILIVKLSYFGSLYVGRNGEKH